MARMTDEQLAKFLGVHDMEKWPAAIAKMDPKKRVHYERLAQKIHEIQLYDAGLGPHPTGVIVCREHDHKQRRKRKSL